MKNIIILLFIMSLILIIAIGPVVFIYMTYSKSIYSLSDSLPDSFPKIGIVFGAAVWKGNQPSPVLYDRIVTAVELYKKGYINKLLLTGNNRRDDYNEPQVMKDTAIKLGVPEKDIFLDFAGRNTFESCYRAVKIFSVKSATLITQRFHLPRALYFCESLGINAVGMEADRKIYPCKKQIVWAAREFLAIYKGWVNIFIWHPKIILGKKIEINNSK